MAIPKRLRELIQLSGNTTLVSTIDIQSPCLLIYPFEEWAQIEQKVMSLPNTKKETRDFQRLFVGFAHELEMDGQGRVLLPNVLRNHVQLEKQGVLLGQGNKLELWPQEAWEPACDEMLSAAKDMPVPDAVAELSI